MCSYQSASFSVEPCIQNKGNSGSEQDDFAHMFGFHAGSPDNATVMDARLDGKAGRLVRAHGLPFPTKTRSPLSFSNGSENHECNRNAVAVLRREQGRNFLQ